MAIDLDTHQDLLDAVYTVQKRSEGLLHFVEAYRKLSRLPMSHVQRIRVSELLARLEQLMRPQLQATEVAFHIAIEPADLELMADAELLEQVLINLIMNALEALDGVARRHRHRRPPR